MSQQLIKTQHPVIDAIAQQIYNELMNDVINYNHVLDLMISIKFTGKLYNTIQESYIRYEYVPRLPWDMNPPIYLHLFALLRQNQHNDPELRDEYCSLITKYLNQRLTKARETLLATDDLISKAIQYKDKWTHQFIYRSTLKGTFREYIILMTNDDHELRNAEHILSEYKQTYFPGAYYRYHDDYVMFSLYSSFPRLQHEIKP